MSPHIAHKEAFNKYEDPSEVEENVDEKVEDMEEDFMVSNLLVVGDIIMKVSLVNDKIGR